jgi:hypothetical protein
LTGMPAFHSSMAAMLSASEKDLTPIGMLTVDWDWWEKVPLYSSTKQKVWWFFVPYFW